MHEAHYQRDDDEKEKRINRTYNKTTDRSANLAKSIHLSTEIGIGYIRNDDNGGSELDCTCNNTKSINGNVREPMPLNVSEND